MIWGFITFSGAGHLHHIYGIMNAKVYCSILEESLLGTLDDHGMSRGCFFFQRDNDCKHTSHRALSWFYSYNIKLLPWPSSSPDMNIIEHVWNELDRRIRRRKRLPRNQEELWVALQEEWYGLDLAFIRKLYDSLPARVEALKKAKGHHTRY